MRIIHGIALLSWLTILAQITVQNLVYKQDDTLVYPNEYYVPPVSYVTKNFTSLVDHFSFGSEQYFSVRYLLNDSFYESGGPILFYTGNEGSIETFAANTLAMWQLAPRLKAALLFVEHRYYGNTMPFGQNSFDNSTMTAYLTAEQALADYAYFLENLRNWEPKLVAKPAPVIAFGGSYGGMLAAWIRHKYPHLVQGAIAASAPVKQFVNITDCFAFMSTVTLPFKRWGNNCANNIRSSWQAMVRVGNGSQGLNKLGKIFLTCAAPTSVQQLADWLNNAYVTAAMVNYPYPANFLLPLPAWPVRAMCQSLNHSSYDGDESLLAAVSAAAATYYNYTGQAKCLNLTAQQTSLDADGWSVQSCNEMVMPDMCTNGQTDMFPPTGDFNLTDYSIGCVKQFGVRPRPNWAWTQFGGAVSQSACSNIFWSNGNLDPWSSGGVVRSPNAKCPAFVIEDGAHHLDLRASDKRDPPGVVQCRAMQFEAISEWIRQFRGEPVREDDGNVV